nr:MAG TPA: hypothetical protein [Myoviridae sp. ctfuG5]DAM92259.1 MAG TPA: hypothetical protein [Caudoviricetes sp.]DAN24663.1 MAG TPA: hypothetical protein [Caudoviricetes sp.]
MAFYLTIESQTSNYCINCVLFKIKCLRKQIYYK